MSHSNKETILVIPDLHLPFQHEKTFEFLSAIKEQYKPTKVVCLGDEVDFHAISKYPSDPDGHSAGRELTLALEQMHLLYEIFPEVKVCTSNHTSRVYRRAFEVGLPKQVIKDYQQMLEAPIGWQWSDEWIIDSILFQHGEAYNKNTVQSVQRSMMNVCYGHTHQVGISYVNIGRATYWGFNVGCLIDNNAYAFAYGKHSKFKPVTGVGIVIDGKPQFVPLD